MTGKQQNQTNITKKHKINGENGLVVAWTFILLLLIFFIGYKQGQLDGRLGSVQKSQHASGGRIDDTIHEYWEGPDKNAEIDSKSGMGDEVYSVGDTAYINDFEITLNYARWDSGTDYSKPSPGERWLVLDITVKSSSNKTALVDAGLFVLVDEEGYSRGLLGTRMLAETKGFLHGDLMAGKTMRGEIPYIVRGEQNRWELITTSPFVSLSDDFNYDEKRVFVITEEDVD